MLLPFHLSPSNWGLDWCLPMVDCVATLNVTLEGQGEGWFTFTQSLEGAPYLVMFDFDDNRLASIVVLARESRDFWERPEVEEEEAIIDDFFRYYNATVEASFATLGCPSWCRETLEDLDPFAITHEMEFTYWFSAGDWLSTQWQTDNTVYGVDVSQGDRELPLVLVVAALRKTPRSTKW